MISQPRPEFWKRYYQLPPEAREQARKAYALFLNNPFHPSLKFKPLKTEPCAWSLRVGLHYRAVGVREGDIIQWFWIGSHADFDREFS